jgi:hypothetical protein
LHGFCFAYNAFDAGFCFFRSTKKRLVSATLEAKLVTRIILPIENRRNRPHKNKKYQNQPHILQCKNYFFLLSFDKKHPV